MPGSVANQNNPLSRIGTTANRAPLLLDRATKSGVYALQPPMQALTIIYPANNNPTLTTAAHIGYVYDHPTRHIQLTMVDCDGILPPSQKRLIREESAG